MDGDTLDGNADGEEVALEVADTSAREQAATRTEMIFYTGGNKNRH